MDLGVIERTTPEHNWLNLGCGYVKLVDHWNVDINPRCNPDEIIDIERTPWPYMDNQFQQITAHNVLEHVGRDPDVFLSVIKEMYRVTKPGGQWKITALHHRYDGFWEDFRHVRPITPVTFKLFDQKINMESIEQQLYKSTYGVDNNIDIEVFDVDVSVLSRWKDQVDEGWLGKAEMGVKINTLANVVEHTHFFVKIHKPGRFEHMIHRHRAR